MSIAFCFLTIGDVTQPTLWQSFFEKRGEFGVFCHPKNPENISTELLKNGIIGEISQTKHGDVSLVSATPNLLRAAFNEDAYEHFILLSETTIPIVSLREIVREISLYKSKSLINYRIPPPGSEHFNRQNALLTDLRMSPFFFHDQWIILSREHVRRLLDKPRIEWFAKMFAADEHYFLNILAHQCRVGVDEIINQRKTYVNWREREIKELKRFDGRILIRTIHPKTYHHLTVDEVKAARSEKNWFFRKVSSQCDCRELIGFTE